MGAAALSPKGANFPRGGPSGNCLFLLLMRERGFTLFELLVVVAIIAVASAGVSLAMRDSAQTQLEREAVRLAALLESGRARSLATGVPVRWRSTAAGFEFDGLPSGALAQGWLSADVTATAPTTLLLGPEPILLPQSVTLMSKSQTARVLKVGSDGVRPFAVQSSDAGPVAP